MIVEPARWHDWKAVCLVRGDCELVVGVSAGPRILSLRRTGGANLLYHDQAPFCVGAWQRYGGHRFTVAPEEARSYEPDNVACTWEHKDAGVIVTAPTRADGVRCALAITAATDGAGFDLQHILENRGTQSWRGAPWAITCVPATAPAVAPRGAATLRYWPDTENIGWQAEQDYVALTGAPAQGKVGWHSESGWLASLQRDATLVIHAPDIPAAQDCTDDGCNVEIYTSALCTELETLGAYVTLAPGSRTTHRQRWRLLPPQFTPQNWAALGAQAGCNATPAHPFSSP